MKRPTLKSIRLAPYWSVHDFWKNEFEKLSWMFLLGFFCPFLLAEKILNPGSGNTTPSSRWHAGITLRSLTWLDNLSDTLSKPKVWIYIKVIWRVHQKVLCQNLKFIESGFGKSSDEQVIRQQKVHFYAHNLMQEIYWHNWNSNSWIASEGPSHSCCQKWLGQLCPIST